VHQLIFPDSFDALDERPLEFECSLLHVGDVNNPIPSESRVYRDGATHGWGWGRWADSDLKNDVEMVDFALSQDWLIFGKIKDLQ
jgi:hypothetical protein